jgi:hypothetical protein
MFSAVDTIISRARKRVLYPGHSRLPALHAAASGAELHPLAAEEVLFIDTPTHR